MRQLFGLFFLALCLASAVARRSETTPFVVQSQTGTVSAFGSTHTLGSNSQALPISGLENVSPTVSVAAGDPNVTYGTPPGYYEASAAISTTLGGNQLSIEGTAHAHAVWDGWGFELAQEGTLAEAEAQVAILFDITAPTTVQLTASGLARQFFFASLRSLDLGFEIFPTGIFDCGALTREQCEAAVYVLGPGAVLSAGRYELSIDTLSREPHVGTCQIFCGGTWDGGLTLTVIPEPTTIALLASGLSGLAAARRGARSRSPTADPVSERPSRQNQRGKR